MNALSRNKLAKLPVVHTSRSSAGANLNPLLKFNL